MTSINFKDRLNMITRAYETLVTLKNEPILPGNGIYAKYKNPVLTAAHVPINWRYDLSKTTNPFLMERFGINAVFNAGAIKIGRAHV